MSQIAPDLTELRAIPEAARGIVYIGAMSAAIRSPAILIAGVSLLLLAAGIGGTQGYRLFGITRRIGGRDTGGRGGDCLLLQDPAALARATASSRSCCGKPTRGASTISRAQTMPSGG